MPNLKHPLETERWINLVGHPVFFCNLNSELVRLFFQANFVCFVKNQTNVDEN